MVSTIWSCRMVTRSNSCVAILDTCVLAPMPLCDTLLRLAEEPVFYVPKWSGDILRELRSTLRRMGYTLPQAERRIVAMELAFEDANVADYQNLVSAMTNDPKDRHVLAAAVQCRAHSIVTHNWKHFPQKSVSPYGLDVLTPDEFLTQHFRADAELLMDKLTAQATARGVGFDTLLARLQPHAPTCVRLLR